MNNNNSRLFEAIEINRRLWQQAVATCEENIRKWKLHQEEYERLKQSLEEYPKKLSHEVMVPFGKVAFMPGRLERTNEVMVLLGDNWFVSRSAFQAVQIVDRRLKFVAENIKKEEEEKSIYVERLEGMRKLMNDDFVEIREPITAESRAANSTKEKKVRIAHRSNQNQNLNKHGEEDQLMDQNHKKKKVSDEEFSDLMNRLEELDRRQEEEENEDDGKKKGRIWKQNLAKPKQQKNADPQYNRKVAWKEDIVEVETAPTASAKVKNDTADEESSSSVSNDKPSSLEQEIHQQKEGRPAKSILKNRDEIPAVGQLPPSPYEKPKTVISSVSEQAFPGQVLERSSPSTTTTTTLPLPSDSGRPMSKFARERAAKMKN